MRYFLGAGLLLAAACTGGDDEPASAAEKAPPSVAERAYAEIAAPADARLASVYNRSCRGCHSVEATGAPLTGQQGAWRARLDAKGMDGLIASVRTGLNAMPAMGFCPDCSDDDFRELINFMATEAE